MKILSSLIICFIVLKNGFAQQPNLAPLGGSAPQAFKLTPDKLGDVSSSVNLFTGDLTFPINLVSLPGRNGQDVSTAIAYSSNVDRQANTWNAEAPTGVVGLGWSFDYPKIIVDNKMTGTREDDTYYVVEGGSSNKLIYIGGKELQKELGIELYDFGSRLYDPFAGRWFAVDPQQQFDSPYAAMDNNPMMMVDPDGEFAFIPFLIMAAKIYGIAHSAYTVASGFANGGLAGGLDALTTTAFSTVLGMGVGAAVGGILPDVTNIKGAVPGGLVGGLSGALSGGLASGAMASIGDGNFWEGFGKGAISGSITGSLAGGHSGYTNAKNAKYETSLTWGTLTHNGRLNKVKDLQLSYGDSNFKVSTVNPKGASWNGKTYASKNGRDLTWQQIGETDPYDLDVRVEININRLKTERRIESTYIHERTHARDYKSGYFHRTFQMYKSLFSYKSNPAHTATAMTVSDAEMNARLNQIRFGYNRSTHKSFFNGFKQAMYEIPVDNYTTYLKIISGRIH